MEIARSVRNARKEMIAAGAKDADRYKREGGRGKRERKRREGGGERELGQSEI